MSIFNKYGALDHTLPISQSLEKACQNFETEIRAIVREHGTNPIDLRCMCDYAVSSITATFAEEVLRKAIDMRKQERMIKHDL